MKAFSCASGAVLAAALAIIVACASRRAQAPGSSAATVASAQSPPASQPAAPSPVSPQAAAPAAVGSLAEEGRARFQSYKCYECHGANGEGTNDGPDLTGTRLNAEQIAAFLQKPSADARSAGMPTIPGTSPDLRALVAYVLSLKRAAAAR